MKSLRTNIRFSIIAGTLLGTVLLAPMIQPARAQGLPSWLNYQGRLTTPAGSAVADGTYTVTFRVFDSPTAGTALWSETKSIATKNGTFATVLGQSVAFPTNLFTKSLFLQVEIGSQVLMPRQALGSVPFAMTALNLPNGTIVTAMIGNAAITTAKIADGAVTEAKLAPGLAIPIGSVISWWGDSAAPPSGWKVCDGTAVADSSSPLNGKVVPDLRDRFVRGSTGNVRSSLPSGGQDAIDLSHSHTVNAHNHSIRGDLAVGVLTAIPHNHRLPNGEYTSTENGVGGNANFDGGSFLVMAHGSRDQREQGLDHNHGGLTGEATPGTSTALSSNQSIVPKYVGLVYIVRVR